MTLSQPGEADLMSQVLFGSGGFDFGFCMGEEEGEEDEDEEGGAIEIW